MPESAAGATAAAGRSRALLSIQILRAVAALGVLTHHALNEKVMHVGGAMAPLNNLVIGVAGVDLFFVISGFVMVYASEQLFGRRDAPRIFLLRRIARIVPLYWAVTAAMILYLLVAHGAAVLMTVHSPGSLIASFLFLPWPRPDGYVFPVHLLGWTLNYEMFFYVAFAAAIVLPRRTAVLTITALFVILTIAGRTVALPLPLSFWSDPIILEFCYGMGVALAYRAGLRFARGVSAALVLVAIAALAASAVLEVGAQWRALAWGVPGAAMVAALTLARGDAQAGPAGRAFGFLGDASYSLYLTHALTFPVVGWVLPRWIDFSALPGVLPWAYAVIAALCAIAAAIASYLLFEKPVTRWLQGRIGRIDAVRPSPLSERAAAATTASRQV